MVQLDPNSLEAFKAEYALLEQQIAANTERHRALGLVIAGLEALLQTPGGVTGAAKQAAPKALELNARRSYVENAVLVLRYVGRPLLAVEIARTFASHRIGVKTNTLYKALRRGVVNGHLARPYPKFGLVEWQRSPV
jgi:hypothetical protein